jgi:tetratricopeptide (TPR) repeat protein
MNIKEVLQIAARSTATIAYLAGALLVFALSLPLIVSTIRGLIAQSELRAATQALHQRGPKAREVLLELRENSPSATASVLLGSFELEEARGLDGFESAERLFSEALELEPGRTSAVIGLISARLKIAELSKDPAILKAAAVKGEELLGDAEDKDHPDVIYLRGALLILQGKTQEGTDLLGEDPASAPTRAGQAARWWNLAVGRLIVKQDALPAAVRAYSLRRKKIPAERSATRDKGDLGPANDPARLLSAAYRFSLADPACKPSSKEAVADRADFGYRVGWQRFTSGRGSGGGQWGRYSPHTEDAAEVMNAVGQGLFRAGKHNLAVDAFNEACKISKRKEVLYLLNLGQSAALTCRLDKTLLNKRRTTVRDLGIGAFIAVGGILKAQKERATLLKLGVDNCLALYFEINRIRESIDLLKHHSKSYPSPADWNRNMGAMVDWSRTAACVRFYEEAVRLGHPDSAAIQERLRLYKKAAEKGEEKK